MKVTPLAAAHLPAFRALFEACGSGCFCRFWHFGGNKNEWLSRCAFQPDDNFEEQRAAVAEGDPSGRGLVAIDDDGALAGWMKLAPRAAMSKLTALPVYRAIPPADGADGATWTVGCFLVHPAKRRRGVARALLGAAEGYVRAAGGRVIEGHPRRADEPLYDEEAWQGPERLFTELGFTAIEGPISEGARVVPYPLYRKVLTAAL